MNSGLAPPLVGRLPEYWISVRGNFGRGGECWGKCLNTNTENEQVHQFYHLGSLITNDNAMLRLRDEE